MPRLADVILRGTRSAQPAANAVAEGAIYYVTDENLTERSDGSSWQTYNDASGAATDHGLLTGLADDDHTQYLLASEATDRATFTAKWADLTAGPDSNLVDANVTQEPWEFILPGTGITVTIEGDSGSVARLAVDTSVVVTKTDTDWTDLTDGGATTLHSHSGGAAYDSTVPTSQSDFVEADDTVESVTDLIQAGSNITITEVGTRGISIAASSGGTAEILPTAVSGLQLWLKADAGAYNDAGSTLAVDNDTVQQWNDQSGNGNNASQSTSTKRAVYKTNIINSLPVLRFDTTDDGYTFASLSVNLPITVFVVCANSGSSGTGNHRYLQGAVNNWFVGYTGNNGSGVDYGLYGGGYVNAVIGSRENNASMLCILCAQETSAIARVYADGYLTTGQFTGNNPGALVIGGPGAFNEPPNADIAEIIVYNTFINSVDRLGVQQYLANKYGISV